MKYLNEVGVILKDGYAEPTDHHELLLALVTVIVKGLEDAQQQYWPHLIDEGARRAAY